MQTWRLCAWTAALLALAAVCLPVAPPVFASFSPFPPAPTQPAYSIRWVSDSSDPRAATVHVSGLEAATLRALQSALWKLADWQRLLAVFAEPRDSVGVPDLPPMLGVYRIRSGVLSFEPQFLLDSDLSYRAVFRPSELPQSRTSRGVPITAIFKFSANRSAPTTVVEKIFPSSQSLPENLLKFYVHFSAPMSRGRIYEHIHLRDDVGKETELPFLEIDEELWDPSMTRLTLFIDPGRIKRGVLPLEEIGPALEVGKRYTLVIDAEWKDATGKPLKTSFQKHFSVVPPDRDPPDPTLWKIQPPTTDTRSPLVVTFPEPMDQALAQRVIQVVRDSGEAVAGEVALTDQERRWAFTPTTLWRRGVYRLVVPTTLEDLAGNNIGKPFEVDLFEGVQRRLATPTVKLPFEVR